MNGRTIFRVLAVVLLVAVAAGLGVAVYNAGLAAGVDQAVQQAAQHGQPITVAPYPYGPYWHGGGFGFGIFGLIFGILGIFLIIGLIRAAFGWGRWGGGGPGRWSHDRGGWNGSDRIAELHRELHRREESGAQPPGQTPTGSSA